MEEKYISRGSLVHGFHKGRRPSETLASNHWVRCCDFILFVFHQSYSWKKQCWLSEGNNIQWVTFKEWKWHIWGIMHFTICYKRRWILRKICPYIHAMYILTNTELPQWIELINLQQFSTLLGRSSLSDWSVFEGILWRHQAGLNLDSEETSCKVAVSHF